MNLPTVPRFRLDRNLTVLIATGMVCVTLLLFAMFIWPTPYKYNQIGYCVFKINRFTGNAERVDLDFRSPKDIELQKFIEEAERFALESSWPSGLVVLSALSVISITAVVFLAWFRGDSVRKFINLTVVAIATSLQKIKFKVINTCASQDIRRPENVKHNGNVEQSQELTVPKPVKQYGGIRRLAYWLGLIGILAMNQVFILTTQGNPIAALFGFTIIITLSLILVMKRFRNMGASEWWSFLILVPVANLFVGARCAVCQEGYHDTRKLDMAGQILSWIIIGFLMFIVLCSVIAI